MSKADKMFEELGYMKNYEDKFRANYENEENIIDFAKDYKEIRIWDKILVGKEIQAINQKCKELGWYE